MSCWDSARCEYSPDIRISWSFKNVQLSLCNCDIQNFIVCAVATFKTLLFVQWRHSKLCLCNRDIQNFIVCAVATFKTLLFVQSRHSKLYCLCSRDIQNFIVCAVETFKTLLFVQSRHSKLYCLCSRAIRNFLVCVSLLGLRRYVRILMTNVFLADCFHVRYLPLGRKVQIELWRTWNFLLVVNLV